MTRTEGIGERSGVPVIGRGPVWKVEMEKDGLGGGRVVRARGSELVMRPRHGYDIHVKNLSSDHFPDVWSTTERTPTPRIPLSW